ncbi:MAG: hypothetical protein ACRD7E_14695 [Bryobacteraceae bacterium]
MYKIALTLCLLASSAFAVTAEKASAPPSDLAKEVAATLQQEGIKIEDGGKTLAEVWFVQTAPAGPEKNELAVSFTKVPQGALMGVMSVPEAFSDRRGQNIQKGLYTLRYSMFPPDGAHQGVSEQRDFLLLSKAAEDKDPKATPSFKALVEASRKASSTPHPLVFSIWKVEGDFKPGIHQEGEEWVLHTKVGDLQLAMIAVGKFGE